MRVGGWSLWWVELEHVAGGLNYFPVAFFDVADQFVFEGIGEGDPGGFDYVFGDAYGGPAEVAVGAFDDYADFGGGGGFGVYYADFVVYKADLGY